MAITALPSAPSRSDPTNFATKADAWVAAMDQFTTEANALQADVNSKQTSAATSASNAATSETNAAASALTALNAPGTQATSATSVALSAGSKSITLAQTGKAFVVGQWVILTDTSTAGQWLAGPITAFTSGTGAMTVQVITFNGTGSSSNWTVTPGTPQSVPPTQWYGVNLGPLI